MSLLVWAVLFMGVKSKNTKQQRLEIRSLRAASEKSIDVVCQVVFILHGGRGRTGDFIRIDNTCSCG